MSTNETAESGIDDEDYIQRILQPLQTEVTVESILSYPMTNVAYDADKTDYYHCIDDVHKKRIVKGLGYVSASFEFYYALHDREFMGGHCED